MVDSTVGMEQQDFVQRIAKGWDVRQAYTWFAKERQDRKSISGLHTLAASVTNMVITNSDVLPPTFTLDYIRLRTLQTQIQGLIFQTGCRWTFEEVLDKLEWRGSIPRFSCDALFARIAAVISEDPTRGCLAQQTEHVTLEIVRGAYKTCNVQGVPTFEDEEFARSNLIYASDPATNVFKVLYRYLEEDLCELVEEEVEAIKDLTPMQISNRYLPEFSVHTPPQHAISQQADLLRVAQQIAHISVLHWRVWAPILYDQPMELCAV